MPRIWQPLPRLRPFVWLHLAFAAPGAGSLQRDPRWWAGHDLTPVSARALEQVEC
jgi:hypothetical protein